MNLVKLIASVGSLVFSIPCDRELCDHEYVLAFLFIAESERLNHPV